MNRPGPEESAEINGCPGMTSTFTVVGPEGAIEVSADDYRALGERLVDMAKVVAKGGQLAEAGESKVAGEQPVDESTARARLRDALKPASEARETREGPSNASS